MMISLGYLLGLLIFVHSGLGNPITTSPAGGLSFPSKGSGSLIPTPSSLTSNSAQISPKISPKGQSTPTGNPPTPKTTPSQFTSAPASTPQRRPNPSSPSSSPTSTPSPTATDASIESFLGQLNTADAQALSAEQTMSQIQNKIFFTNDVALNTALTTAERLLSASRAALLNSNGKTLSSTDATKAKNAIAQAAAAESALSSQVSGLCSTLNKDIETLNDLFNNQYVLLYGKGLTLADAKKAALAQVDGVTADINGVLAGIQCPASGECGALKTIVMAITQTQNPGLRFQVQNGFSGFPAQAAYVIGVLQGIVRDVGC